MQRWWRRHEHSQKTLGNKLHYARREKYGQIQQTDMNDSIQGQQKVLINLDLICGTHMVDNSCKFWGVVGVGVVTEAIFFPSFSTVSVQASTLLQIKLAISLQLVGAEYGLPHGFWCQHGS